MMILSQKPQMMSHQSTIPVFIDEMPEPIIFDSPSKKKKLTKAKR
jgi:hypothetical protein